MICVIDAQGRLHVDCLIIAFVERHVNQAFTVTFFQSKILQVTFWYKNIGLRFAPFDYKDNVGILFDLV